MLMACPNCSELWWNIKGHACERCNRYCCYSWQNMFIYETCEQKFETGICAYCFLLVSKQNQCNKCIESALNMANGRVE